MEQYVMHNGVRKSGYGKFVLNGNPETEFSKEDLKTLLVDEIKKQVIPAAKKLAVSSVKAALRKKPAPVRDNIPKWSMSQMSQKLASMEKRMQGHGYGAQQHHDPDQEALIDRMARLAQKGGAYLADTKQQSDHTERYFRDEPYHPPVEEKADEALINKMALECCKHGAYIRGARLLDGKIVIREVA
ncbi:MAG: hypothetical protein V2I97_15980 [Desulfococcaceae bacterium]|jgi:hypothetical protein|nr:hypothetical protein [Desulfococcaceae bacterium]